MEQIDAIDAIEQSADAVGAESRRRLISRRGMARLLFCSVRTLARFRREGLLRPHLTAGRSHYWVIGPELLKDLRRLEAAGKIDAAAVARFLDGHKTVLPAPASGELVVEPDPDAVGKTDDDPGEIEEYPDWEDVSDEEAQR